MERIFLDTEYSAKFSYDETKTGSLLQLSAIAIRDGVEVSRFDQLMKPVNKIWSVEAEDVHGISRVQARVQKDSEIVLLEFLEWIKSLGDSYWRVCGFNSAGDNNYLCRILSRYGMLTSFYLYTYPDWLDVLSIARKRKNYLQTSNMTLTGLCEYFGIEINAHNAMWDCWGTWKLCEALETIKLPNVNYQTLDFEKLTKRQRLEKFIEIRYLQSGTDGSLYLTKEATSNPEAMETILEYLWDKHVNQI